MPKNAVIGISAVLAASVLAAVWTLSIDPAGTTAVEMEDDRAELRAFYSAPPVIPHEVAPNQAQQCQFCHDEVKETPFGISVKTPHPQMTNCFQCHVVQSSTLGEPAQQYASAFEGLLEPKTGSRNNPAAPPTIPHRTAMRENCLSCHAPDNPDPNLRTPHPERSQCMQCHVSAMDAEFTIHP